MAFIDSMVSISTPLCLKIKKPGSTRFPHEKTSLLPDETPAGGSGVGLPGQPGVPPGGAGGVVVI
jgi:hypothetical protein